MKNSEPAATILHRLDQAPWSTAFAVELAQRLRDRDPNSTPTLRWLNDRLAAEKATSDQIVRDEFQRQSATDVTVRNVIMSMRLISMINWPEFFESVSAVDAVMRAGSDFAAMDFPTRDRYRRSIEELARGSGRDEVEVARRAIDASRRAADQTAGIEPATQQESDPGYYLVATGRAVFEKELGYRVPFRTRLFRFNSDLGVLSYIGMVAIVTAVFLLLVLLAVASTGIAGWQLLVLAMVGLVPASDVAVAVVNRAVTQLVSGMLLPGLELRNGVTPDLRTIIVVPTMLGGIPELREQIERLEVHHLSNADENFTFALISDWCDCATEHAVNDESLLREAMAGIARLNARYGPAGDSSRFFLLHRRRMWNEGEGMWIGWERKRGKLRELNRLLRGATDTTFLPLDGHAPALPSGIRYVITLDADTRLPIGTARRLVGKLAHPLNRPHFDLHAGRVVRGHGMLQPRVTPSLPIGSEGSLFQRAFSGPNGLDPYALAVSDVYQDMFEEGSYCGKGIYEIDSFEAALEGQIPNNSVLSHDLLEGIFARAGLASDIEVVEEFPSRYSVAAARQHRWVRGDWQLLALDLRLWGQGSRWFAQNPAPVDGALEAPRQSAPLAFRAGCPTCAADCLVAADACRRDVDRVYSSDHRAAASAAGDRQRRSASCRRFAAQSFAHAARRFHARPFAECFPRHLPRTPGLGDGRRRGADALSSVRSSTPFARVGDRRAGYGCCPIRPPRTLRCRSGRAWHPPPSSRRYFITWGSEAG